MKNAAYDGTPNDRLMLAMAEIEPLSSNKSCSCFCMCPIALLALVAVQLIFPESPDLDQPEQTEEALQDDVPIPFFDTFVSSLPGIFAPRMGFALVRACLERYREVLLLENYYFLGECT